jgi:hypothetical protein
VIQGATPRRRGADDECYNPGGKQGVSCSSEHLLSVTMVTRLMVRRPLEQLSAAYLKVRSAAVDVQRLRLSSLPLHPRTLHAGSRDDAQVRVPPRHGYIPIITPLLRSATERPERRQGPAAFVRHRRRCRQGGGGQAQRGEGWVLRGGDQPSGHVHTRGPAEAGGGAGRRQPRADAAAASLPQVPAAPGAVRGGGLVLLRRVLHLGHTGPRLHLLRHHAA